MIGRRKFLGAIAAAPMAASAIAQETAANLSGLSINGAAKSLGSIAGVNQGLGSYSQTKAPDYKSLFSNPAFRQGYEALIYERERRVGAIDPDISCMRSFSLSAKITFQRQRNVQREIEQMQLDNPWSRAQDFISKALGFKP